MANRTARAKLFIAVGATALAAALGVGAMAAPAQAAPAAVHVAAAKAKAFKKAPTPKISGTAAYTKTLTASAGTWSPKPSKITYTWYVGSSKVGTGKTFKITTKVVGKKITVKVTASKKGYKTTTKPSKVTKTVAAATLKVTITQTASGVVVKAPAGSKVTYVWTDVNGIVVGRTATRPSNAKLFLAVTVSKAGYKTVKSSKSFDYVAPPTGRTN